MQRKIIFSILSLSLIFSLVGCQTSSGNETSKAAETVQTDTSTDTNIPSGTDSDKKEDSSTDVNDLEISDDDFKEIDSIEDKKEEDDEEEDEKEEKNKKTPEPSSIDIDGYTLKADLVSLSDKLEVSDRSSLDCALFGDRLYILDGRKLIEYTLSDDSASKEDETKLDAKFKKIDIDPYGQVYLSNDVFNIAKLEEDRTLTELDLTGNLALSKVMDFGLSFFNGKDSIFKFGDSDTEETFWQESEDPEESYKVFDSITDIEFVGNHILIGGTTDGENQRVAVYDYEGNQLAITDNKVNGKSIDSMTETDSGLMVSAVGNLSIWNSDGSEIGQTKSSETTKLFGTENPVWINKLIAMDDGSVLVLCSTETKDDEYKAYLYKVWGF